MSITVSAVGIKGKERQEILEEILRQIKEATLQVNKQIIMACLEAEVTASILDEKKGVDERCVLSHTKSTGNAVIVEALMPINSRVTGIIRERWKPNGDISSNCGFPCLNVKIAIMMLSVSSAFWRNISVFGLTCNRMPFSAVVSVRVCGRSRVDGVENWSIPLDYAPSTN